MVSSQNDKDLCFCYSLDGNCLFVSHRHYLWRGDVKVTDFILKQKKNHIYIKLISGRAPIGTDIISYTYFSYDILVSLFAPAALPAFYTQRIIGLDLNRTVL